MCIYNMGIKPCFSRLMKQIERELKFKFECIFHLTDSSIVHALILNESSRFATFVAYKVAVIQRK